jgi:GT2 family glycosyltransferase
MTHSNPITFCISTWNNLPYLKIAIDSVRKNSYFKDAPFIIHAENCTDGTNKWLSENHLKYNLQIYIQANEPALGIGGGMNFCADKVSTEYIMFLHSDFYVTKDWDIECLNEHKKHSEPTWVFSQRVEPDMFDNGQSRPGTIIVPIDAIGAYHDDFNSDAFDQFALEFCSMNDVQIEKAEGVSGLIKKEDWDKIGGNDSQFAPTSWEDMDLFLRMKMQNYKFVLTTKSLVWHFGARGSHRLEENNGKSSSRQLEAEHNNAHKWVKKWGGLPIFDHNKMIQGIL